ncbi:DUF488 domain-containing protein [Rufibacter ruber]|uniref:DUF488 domain-containing protein n=1 Tax=Rufibacter ruber TaxID=1783499 RepID=UPI001F4E56B8|nr:DUF488 domain-containing protein [Rufibacter ruber]
MLQLFEGSLEKTRLQKLLFLLTQKQLKKEYDFIPYKFGCFSFSVQADLVAMIRKGMLAEDGATLVKNDKVEYYNQLKESDKKLLLEVKALYGKMGSQALIKHTYINYPYFAINSEIITEILSQEEACRVSDAKPTNNTTALFTIGYEGISLEEYLNKLIKNDVAVLVDVRKNPLSQKFGFSKTQLGNYCGSLGIKYVHIPEVGIDSNQRQDLNTQADYDKLFAEYKSKNLMESVLSQEKILNLVIEFKRVGLTCFEADICQCHRKPLAEAVARLPDFPLEIKHI